jgi:hypothetical protein
MSYTVNRQLEGFGGSFTSEQRSYTIPYIVESSTKDDWDINAARKATGMPAIGSKLTQDSGAFCDNISLSGIEFGTDATKFTFTTTFATKQVGENNENSSDPLKTPPRISYGTVTYSRVMEAAYNTTAGSEDDQGDPTEPVTNSAGQPFDPPLMGVKVNSLVTIQYNNKNFGDDWIEGFVNTTNKSAVSVASKQIQANHGKIKEISAENNFKDDGTEYWSITVQIEISDEPFKRKVQDRGFSVYLSAGSPSPDEVDPLWVVTDNDAGTSEVLKKSTISDFATKFKNGTAEPVAEAQKLDGAGGIYTGDANNAVYLEYQESFQKEWDTLNIPQLNSSNTNNFLGGV